jgi:hypothetical protein
MRARRRHFRWRHLADARQRVDQLLLLEGDLCGRRQVLQGATATDAEVRAARRQAVRRGLLDRHCLPFVGIARGAGVAKTHPLARQGIGDERRLAVDPRHAAALVVEVDDLRRVLAGGQGLFATHSDASSVEGPRA